MRHISSCFISLFCLSKASCILCSCMTSRRRQANAHASALILRRSQTLVGTEEGPRTNRRFNCCAWCLTWRPSGEYWIPQALHPAAATLTHHKIFDKSSLEVLSYHPLLTRVAFYWSSITQWRKPNNSKARLLIAKQLCNWNTLYKHASV